MDCANPAPAGPYANTKCLTIEAFLLALAAKKRNSAKRRILFKQSLDVLIFICMLIGNMGHPWKPPLNC